MKQLILNCSCLLLSLNLSYGQIQSGQISFIRIDSFSQEYEWKAGKGSSDTIVVMEKGNWKVQVVDDSNYKIPYENGRDTLTSWFSPDQILTPGQYDNIQYSDLKLKKSYNYALKDGVYQLQASFRMFEDFPKPGVVSKMTIDRNDRKTFAGVEGYKLEYTETIHGSERVVTGYVTDKIAFPFRLFFEHEGLGNTCPLYLEQYYRGTPRKKKVFQLIAIQETSKATAVNTIGEYLKKIKG